jgi:hypothetical protein
MLAFSPDGNVAVWERRTTVYDRSILRAVAREKGDETSADMSRRLGVAPVTAWRLWNGTGGPSATVAAAVKRVYGLDAADLLRKAA